ncbi:MAG: (Fe-S)-binding protein, partial [Burkholderiaceae bacterium]
LDALRGASGGRLPKWSPALPRPIHFHAPHRAEQARAERVIYFPSCAARNMGAQRGDGTPPLPEAAERLFRKAGFDVLYPEKLDELCCGQPFESKGLMAAADLKSAELEAALRAVRGDASWPIVFDTSPCAWRMRRYLGPGSDLVAHDVIEFLHDAILPRVSVRQTDEPVAIHPVCSVRKMGTVDKLSAIARRCSSEVVTVDEVLCCGFAGDKGFTRPELNEYALRHLKQAIPPQCTSGYSSSRTCEIGLSEQSGLPYRSIVHLVDECVEEVE